MFENLPWFSPTAAPAPLPLGLKHLDSDLCWCDPVVEIDDDGAAVVLHKQVTWN
jgi:hypothetical protein